MDGRSSVVLFVRGDHRIVESLIAQAPFINIGWASKTMLVASRITGCHSLLNAVAFIVINRLIVFVVMIVNTPP